MDFETFRDAAGIDSTRADRWYRPVKEAMDEFFINSPKRQAMFIAQIGHESAGFSRVTESFNYSIPGLKAVFGHRLPDQECERLGRQPGETTVPRDRQMQIANAVYGGRYGNWEPGDGWRFRGRGLKMITFRSNYKECGEALGLDLLWSPDLLLQAGVAARSAGWYWDKRRINRKADRGDIVGASVAINGGKIGLDDRVARWDRAREVFGA